MRAPAPVLCGVMEGGAQARDRCDLSILVPVYNEAESLETLYGEITAACSALEGVRQYELVFVDDGSTDGSSQLLDGFVDRDAHVAVIHFRRNFGKSPALAAGFERVRGQIVLTLDADLQDDPAMIDDFVKRHGTDHGP